MTQSPALDAPQPPAAPAPQGQPFAFTHYSQKEARPGHSPPGSTWDAFCLQLVLPFRPASKFDAPAWSPATFDTDGVRRLNTNVRAVHAYVADIDHQTWASLGTLLAKLDALGLDYLAHSTASNGWTREVKATKRSPVAIPSRPDPNECCFRVIVPLATPVAGKDWEDAWWRASTFLGLADLADNLADSARLYFRPHQGAITRRGAGRYWLDLGKLPGLPRGQGFEVRRAAMRHRIDPDVLIDFAERASRSEVLRRAEVGKTLKKVLNGVVYADKGDAHNANLRMSGYLARAFPDADPDDLAEYWAVSEQVMWPGVVSDMAACLRYDLDKVQHEIEEKSRLTLQTAGPGVRPEYTADELHAMAPTEKLWIVQRDSSYYARTIDGYKGPYSSTESLSAMAIDLAPARLALLHPATTPGGRPIRKNLVELVDEFGTVGLNTIVDLTATRSTYEPTTRTITEAPCPLRYPELTPEYSQEVDTWLRLLTRTDEHHANLVRWLSHVCNLEKTLAAIVFTGSPHVGKGAFANGVARMWSTLGANDIKDVLGPWNDTIISNGPVVFADEELPKNFRGEVEFGLLRKLVGDHGFKLRRRYKPVAMVKGCLRLIVAANNEDIFNTRGALRNNDVEALASRFYLIDVGDVDGPDAARTKAFIEHHAPKWFREETIARHVMQLNIQRQEVALQPRFGIVSTDRRVMNTLAVNSGYRGKICQVLLSWLDQPFWIGKVPKIITLGGKLYATAGGLAEAWNRGTGELPPGHSVISSALADLLATRARHEFNGLKYREVSIELIARFSDMTDGGGEEWVRRRIAETEVEHSRLGMARPQPTRSN